MSAAGRLLSGLAAGTQQRPTLLDALAAAALPQLDAAGTRARTRLAALAGAPLDLAYARLGGTTGPFFADGWGDLNVVNFEQDLALIRTWPPQELKARPRPPPHRFDRRRSASTAAASPPLPAGPPPVPLRPPPPHPHCLSSHRRSASIAAASTQRLPGRPSAHAAPLSKMVAPPPPAAAAPQVGWRLLEEGPGHRLFEGTFVTPCAGRVWDNLPHASRTGRARMLLPRRWGADAPPAGFVHLAATGDHGFERRLRLAAPMLKQGVAALALESPFYGARRPPGQRGAKLRAVSDLLTLGWATIYESLHLLHWLSASEGYGSLGVAGLSMGGVHACMTAALYPGEVAVAPLLAPRSAAVAYCDGALAGVTAWRPMLAAADGRDAAVGEVLAAAMREGGGMRAAAHAMAAAAQIPELSAAGGAPPQRQPLAGAAAAVPARPHHHHHPAHGHSYGQHAAEQRSGRLSATPSSSAPQGQTVEARAALGELLQRLSRLRLPRAQLRQQQADPAAAGAAGAAAAGAAGAAAAAGPEQREALTRLKAVLETYTDVTRYPLPRRPDAAVFVAAEDDAYVCPASVAATHAYWAGSGLRTVSGGHVSAFLLHQEAFREAMAEALQRLRREPLESGVAAGGSSGIGVAADAGSK